MTNTGNAQKIYHINLHILIIISNEPTLEPTLLYNFVVEFRRKNYQESGIGSGKKRICMPCISPII